MLTTEARNFLKHMDVFLEDSGNTAGKPGVLSRLAIARPLRAGNPEELLHEVFEIRQQGIRYVTVRRQQVFRIGEDVLKDVFSDFGIQISSIGFAGGFTGTLGMTYANVIADAHSAIRMAHDVGARSLVLVTGHQGLHIYNHAERTVQEGIEICRRLAMDYRIRLLVAANSVLGCRRDNFRPRTCPLLWTQQFCGPELQTMIVVRAGERLPDGWRGVIASGGCLRICHKCESYPEHTDLLNRIISFLSRRNELAE